MTGSLPPRMLRARVLWPLTLATLVAGCGGSPAPSAASSGRPSGSAAKSGPAPALSAAPLCTEKVDIADLLTRHAGAFGSAAAVAAGLPRTLRNEEEIDGKKGWSELVLDASAFRAEEVLPGIHQAYGIDRDGPWRLGLAGVVFRPKRDEANVIAANAWMARRSYLGTFDANRVRADCIGQAGARLRFALPELGDPELTFALASAALLTSSFAAADGSRSTTTYETWSDHDPRGVRWPRSGSTTDESSNTSKFLLKEVVSGAACSNAAKESCLSPPTPALQFSWPASGIVRVPMKHYLGEVSLKVRLNDRDAWALLDSGAEITVVDATTPAGKAFVSSLALSGQGSTQAIEAGLGKLETLGVGDLALTNLPTASIPIPALDDFGNRRPEVILGFSFFLGAAVRVDYAKSEVVFARNAEPLIKSGATAVPIRVMEDKAVADVMLDGVAAPLELDTGNASGISLVKPWADAHGFPGSRASVAMTANTGAGVGTTTGTLFRLANTALGAIHHDNRVVSIHAPPHPGNAAGLVGNDVFSHCRAVIFDLAKRSLWLEPPCDGRVPESKTGWRFDRKESPDFKDRPWILETVIAGGAAEKAGLLIGDRVLSVGGVPADLDSSKIQAVIERPAGTKVVVQFVRDGVRKETMMTLEKLLAR